MLGIAGMWRRVMGGRGASGLRMWKQGVDGKDVRDRGCGS